MPAGHQAPGGSDRVVIPVPNHGEGRGYRADAVDIRAETRRDGSRCLTFTYLIRRCFRTERSSAWRQFPSGRTGTRRPAVWSRWFLGMPRSEGGRNGMAAGTGANR